MNFFMKFIVYPFGAIAIIFGLYIKLGFMDLHKLNSTELKVVPIAIVMLEYSQNELRAKENYKNKPIQVVGVFDSMQDQKLSLSSDLKVIIRESWSGGFMYVNLPKDAKKELINIDKGTLVSVNCMNLDTYGMSPMFETCDYIKKIDTKGERPNIFLDKLIWENNPLVNPKKEKLGSPKVEDKSFSVDALFISLTPQKDTSILASFKRSDEDALLELFISPENAKESDALIAKLKGKEGEKFSLRINNEDKNNLMLIGAELTR
jgi:hypothetical protein